MVCFRSDSPWCENGTRRYYSIFTDTHTHGTHTHTHTHTQTRTHTHTHTHPNTHYYLQSTSLITTLGGGIRKGSLFAKCRYTRSLITCIQVVWTLLWAWKFCRYSRIVVISAVVISEVDCTNIMLIAEGLIASKL